MLGQVGDAGIDLDPFQGIVNRFLIRLVNSCDLDADLLLLVETRTRFYSQLNGRYRWTVDAKITLAKREAREEAVSSSIDVPVFLDFDHQREREALVVAGPRIADEVARLADELVTGLGSTATLHPPFDSAANDAASLRVRRDVLLAGPVVKKSVPAPESIYFVMVDRFANGDKSNDGTIDPLDGQAFHGGDLQGVLDHLDHLQSLGISTVWLSPGFSWAMRASTCCRCGASLSRWRRNEFRAGQSYLDDRGAGCTVG